MRERTHLPWYRSTAGNSHTTRIPDTTFPQSRSLTLLTALTYAEIVIKPCRSAILTYHSIDDSGSVISMPPATFRHHMDFLAEAGIPVIPLAQSLIQPGSVAITFDDGFANLVDHAIPVLAQYNFPATIFLVAKYCGGQNNWPGQSYDKAAVLPLMSWEQAAALPPSITIGAHTVNHPDLTRIDPAECERELRDSQAQIEQRIGRPARCLAYPYGSSSRQVQQTASRYFDLAVGTTLRFLPDHPNTMDLPRIDTFYLRDSFPIERLLTPVGSAYIGLRNLLRQLRQLASR
jgi:peptidoglycan/xylan/chitin deacetylase (PgdA/CDA1 family)